MFYIFLLLGTLIRIIFIPVSGFKADVAFWKGWGLAVADKGILWLANNTNYNYPPGFAYVLWVINKIYALFNNPYNIGEYWNEGNLLYLFLIKLITIVADILIVILIIKIGQIISKSQIPQISKIFALFYFLNPAVIYNGVIWGQVDQFGLAFFLLSIYLILKDRPKIASAVFMTGCLMKFQNIIFIPLFFLFIFKRFSFRQAVESGLISVITFITIITPFWLNRQIESLIRLLLINSDWFPWYSLNAFNGWWIASGLKGMQLVDKHLVFGITSAKQFGFFMFIFAYFIACVLILFSKKENLFKNFILASSLAVFSFFHLLTQSHERYLFPVMGLLLIYGISYFNGGNIGQAKMEDRRWKLDLIFFSTFYLLLSTFFFINMYISMVWNYPDQGWMPFSKEQTLSWTYWLSLGQIGLFLIFFIWCLSEIWKLGQIRLISLVGGVGMMLILALFWKNTDYFMGKPVSLTLLKPISYRQDYLEPVYNKTVESARGVHYWNRLSVNYYFYEKGIGSHANSEITYHLGKRFSKFSTDFGIDTEGGESAKVYFSVLGDGKELFRSKVKGRFDPPSQTDVDVREVTYLTLKIINAGDSINGAHADWLNPVITK